MDFQSILLIALICWNVFVTGVCIYFALRIKSFILEVNKGNLLKLLERVIRSESQHSNSIKALKNKLSDLEGNSKFHIQKTSLIRFNPFEDLGGEHSFVLVLLDAFNNGIILTGLHTRERTRIYVKNIKEGKSSVELSKEEKKALAQALGKSYE